MPADPDDPFSLDTFTLEELDAIFDSDDEPTQPGRACPPILYPAPAPRVCTCGTGKDVHADHHADYCDLRARF